MNLIEKTEIIKQLIADELPYTESSNAPRSDEKIFVVKIKRTDLEKLEISLEDAERIVIKLFEDGIIKTQGFVSDNHFHEIKELEVIVGPDSPLWKINPAKKKIPSHLLSFNSNSGELYFNGRICNVPLVTNQYFLCQLLFSKEHGERITDEEVVSLSGWKRDKSRSVYDAARFINEKARDELKIDKLIFTERNHVWLNPELNRNVSRS